jgi:hypothetical protein
MFYRLRRIRFKLALPSLALIFGCLFLSQLHAIKFIPVSSNSLNPFLAGQSFLQPQHWIAPGDDQLTIRLQVEAANYSIQTETATESLILDGEIYQSIVHLHYSVSEQISVKASVPYIHYTGGIMDDAIEQWHRWFGLSNSRRTGFPSRQLHFEYLVNGVSQTRVIGPTDGLGDIRLGLDILPEYLAGKNRSLSFSLDLKLRTGDPDRLTGSGSTDFGLSLHAITHRVPSTPLSLYGGLGVIFPGKGKIISTPQEALIYSAYTGIHWNATKRLVLTTQLNLQTAVYESTLNELDKNSSQLLFSATYQAATDLLYQLSFGENLYTDATPDFSLHFAVLFR